GLRKRGYQGRIVLLGEEAQLPYQRPPLSKAFLLGKVAPAQLAFRPQAVYEQANIELRLGTRVESIDRQRSEVVLGGGERLAYDRLVLATGSRPRWLRFPGVENGQLENLLALRTVADADSLRARLAQGQRLVIIGGGYIGLEVAASATQLGAKVTVLE